MSLGRVVRAFFQMIFVINAVLFHPYFDFKEATLKSEVFWVAYAILIAFTWTFVEHLAVRIKNRNSHPK